METKSVADAVIRISELFGVTGLLIMIAGALLGLAIWKDKRGGLTTREAARKALPDLSPLTCNFSDINSVEAVRTARDTSATVDKIYEKVIAIEARQSR